MEVKNFFHQWLNKVRVDIKQHLGVALVEVPQVSQLHEKLWKNRARREQRMSRHEELPEQQRVALLLTSNNVFLGQTGAVGREQRDHEHQDQRRLLGLKIDGDRAYELHVIIEKTGSDLCMTQLFDVHCLRFHLIDRVEEMLLVLIECYYRTNDQKFDAAALQ